MIKKIDFFVLVLEKRPFTSVEDCFNWYFGLQIFKGDIIDAYNMPESSEQFAKHLSKKSFKAPFSKFVYDNFSEIF